MDREKDLVSTKIGKLIIDFLNYIEIEKGRSLKTRENYRHYLKVFVDHTKVSHPEDITSQMVTEFRLWLNRQPALQSKSTRFNDKTLTKKTQNYYLIALRAFLKYLARQEIKSLPAERIELAKVSERTLELITQTELDRLLNSPNTSSVKDLRDKAILELLFSTGLRVSELCSLTSDIDLTSDEISIRGKGGKVRVVFLSDEAKKHVKNYLVARKDMSEALFVQIASDIPAKKGTKKTDSLKTKDLPALTKRSVERIVKQHAVKAGISKKVTPHMLRHMFATGLLSAGADIRSVQALLGHSSVITTQIYTHVTDKHLREVHKKFHKKR